MKLILPVFLLVKKRRKRKIWKNAKIRLGGQWYGEVTFTPPSPPEPKRTLKINYL